MAKTQAERAAEYRQRKRDESVTAKRDAPSVTNPASTIDAPLETEGLRQVRAKPTFTDLPTDVQRQIEQHCAESNNGARAGSHSRAAMTERALNYQSMFGKWPGRGASFSERIA